MNKVFIIGSLLFFSLILLEGCSSSNYIPQNQNEDSFEEEINTRDVNKEEQKSGKLLQTFIDDLKTEIPVYLPEELKNNLTENMFIQEQRSSIDSYFVMVGTNSNKDDIRTFLFSISGQKFEPDWFPLPNIFSTENTKSSTIRLGKDIKASHYKQKDFPNVLNSDVVIWKKGHWHIAVTGYPTEASPKNTIRLAESLSKLSLDHIAAESGYINVMVTTSGQDSVVMVWKTDQGYYRVEAKTLSVYKEVISQLKLVHKAS